MKIRVEHEIKGRIRFSTNLGRLNPEQADCLLYYLLSLPGVKSAKVYERSGDGVVFYQGERRELLKQAMEEAIRRKPGAHCFERPEAITEEENMIRIGG